VQTQWRMGFGGATGLDYLALEKTAQWLGVRMDRLMLEKIQTLESNQLRRFAEIRERDREGNTDAG
jgi:hypothetical protein